VDVFQVVQLPVGHFAYEEHGDMHFSAIPVINLYNFVIIIDHIRYKDNPLYPELLRIYSFSRERTSAQTCVTYQVRWSCVVFCLIFLLRVKVVIDLAQVQ
jgi:hypothetical protein